MAVNVAYTSILHYVGMAIRESLVVAYSEELIFTFATYLAKVILSLFC